MPIDAQDGFPTAVSPNEHVIFTEFDGAEAVLVDLDSKQYYLLNETASVIWRGLANGTPPAGIARQITELYDVTLAHAEASVLAAIGQFIEFRVVKRSG